LSNACKLSEAANGSHKSKWLETNATATAESYTTHYKFYNGN